MKLVQVAGWLGSGKTTLIITLGRELSKRGRKVAILVNEIGAVPVDGKVMEEYGLTVKDIGGGCICCQVAGNMVRTLKLLKEGPNPDTIIVEPTGIAVPSSINETIRAAAEQLNVSIGPTVVLFDTTRLEKLLTYDSLRRLVTTQLKDADIIALSKVDLATGAMISQATESVRLINPGAQIINLSTVRGDGVSVLAQAMLEMTVSV